MIFQLKVMRASLFNQVEILHNQVEILHKFSKICTKHKGMISWKMSLCKYRKYVMTKSDPFVKVC